MHLHVWGCKAEIRIYNLQEKKLDARIINGYFIGYIGKSKEFIENGEISGSTVPQDVEIKEVRVQVSLTCASSSKVGVPPIFVQGNNEEKEHNNELIIQNELIVEEPQEIALRRSQRDRRPAISNDYMVARELVVNGSLRVNVTVMATSNVKRLESLLKDDNDYKETFSLVSRKDSFRISMILVVYYNLELNHMNKSIYKLKQASQWYLKFDDIIVSLGFKENIVYPCIYLKVSGSKVIFLILYVDDILLATNDLDLGLVHESKKFLSNNFEMKNMGEAIYHHPFQFRKEISLVSRNVLKMIWNENKWKRFRMYHCWEYYICSGLYSIKHKL
ncbi:hypothetical protein CR513_01440, partial [Mucuna pruriens]